MSSVNPEDTVQRQQEALVASIKELEHRERQRLHRLSNAKSKSEHHALHERFDRERKLEKERVEQLMNDFFQVEQQLKKNNVRSFLQERQTFKQSQHQSQRENQHLPNRFEGIESHVDVIFHADIARKFEKYDKRYQAKQNYVPYDPIKEDRKLRLLTQKRDLLQNLISLQSTATGVQPTFRGNSRRASDTCSMISGSSSGASYATFATSHIGKGSISSGNNTAGTRHAIVPRLHLK